jgi:hypothetical protein
MPVKHADIKRKKALKILLFGGYGSGKTHFALKATPGATLIFDAESGADFFEGKKGFDFDYWTDDDGLKTASIKELNKAIDYLQSAEGNSKYKTFIIDPISDIWDSIQEQRAEYKDDKARDKGKNIDERNEAELESFNVKDWGDMKRIYKGLMLRLKNLPQNVILVAREKEISETKPDGSLVRTGEYTYDAEKSTGYATDFAVRIVFDEKKNKRWAHISKTRSDGLEMGEKVDNPTFALFEKVVNSMDGGKDVSKLSTQHENIFTEPDELKELKEEIIALATKLGGSKNPEMMTVLKEIEPSGNPNKIKDLETLQKLFDALSNVKPLVEEKEE